MSNFDWFFVLWGVLLIIIATIAYFKYSRSDYESQLFVVGEVSDIDIRERALKIFAELYKKPIEVVKHDLEKIRRRKR